MIHADGRIVRVAVPFLILLAACWRTVPLLADTGTDGTEQLDVVAESYVRLVLGLGNHDRGYVDYYYGPDNWRSEAEATIAPLPVIRARAESLLTRLSSLDDATWDQLTRRRASFLETQLGSLIGRSRMLDGETFRFNQESRLIYDALVPAIHDTQFADIVAQLDRLLPGSGPIHARYEAFLDDFVVPPDRLERAFRAAVEEARSRTLRHIELPAGESFEIEFVQDASWAAYNHYKGRYHSLIQVNTDLPIRLHQLLGCACHEGYPGHHTSLVLWEKHLYEEGGWVECSVYPLHSPISVVLEGSAEYAIDLAFPPQERLAFERATLYPLAGLDPDRAELYAAIRELVRELDYVWVDVARRYLDGELDRQAAAGRLTELALIPPAGAEQEVDFFDDFGAYTITYPIGRRLVRDHVERGSGTPARIRWSRFQNLIRWPRVPSTLTD